MTGPGALFGIGRTSTTYDLLTTLTDVETLVRSGQRESETLEYKTATRPLGERDFTELAKDVSAFANSAGGLLVYGVATDRADKTKPIAIEPVLADNIDIILQVVSTHVRHPIPGVRWKTVVDGQGTPVCLLVDVPASPLAPHQVAIRDYRYYRRHGAHSEPMTHDLLELYFGRRLGPIIEIQPRLARADLAPSDSTWAGRFHVSVILYNAGQRAAKNTLVLMYVPRGVDWFELLEYPAGPHAEVTHGDDSTKVAVRLGDFVLHPELEATAFAFTFRLGRGYHDAEVPFIHIGVHADDMKSRKLVMWLEPDGAGAFKIGLSSDDAIGALASDSGASR